MFRRTWKSKICFYNLNNKYKIIWNWKKLMVTFAPENAPVLKFTGEILHSHRGVWHCVSAKRIFTCLLMHRHNCRASWFKIFNRTGTTESIGDFFLLNLRKTPRVRANGALRFVSRNTHWVASFKIALIQERHGRCSNTVISVLLWKLQLFRNWTRESS